MLYCNVSIVNIQLPAGLHIFPFRNSYFALSQSFKNAYFKKVVGVTINNIPGWSAYKK